MISQRKSKSFFRSLFMTGSEEKNIGTQYPLLAGIVLKAKNLKELKMHISRWPITNILVVR